MTMVHDAGTPLTLHIRLSDSAHWIAQDENGDWFEYEQKPLSDRYEDSWAPHEFDNYYRSIAIAMGVPPKDWRTTLIGIKREE